MSADIDIDVPDRQIVLSTFKCVHAMRDSGDGLVRHNTGIYPMAVPHNPFTMESTIDYKDADSRGFVKVDILNLSVYKNVKSRSHLDKLLNMEPDWNRLLDSNFSDNIFQLNGWSHIVQEMKPSSVLELAAVISMIRPAKRHLVGKSWDEVFAEVWVKPDNDKYFFKKSHAISYAMVAVVSINLLCEEEAVGCHVQQPHDVIS